MINEAVILLGGMGTRLLPYTKTVPKEMLPIYNVPMIYLLVKEAYLSGIRKIIFVVTEHNRKIIEDFFSHDKYLDDFLIDKPDKKEALLEVETIINQMQFQYVYQDLKGTYGALYSAKDFILNDNFVVMYGDDLIDTNPPITSILIENYYKTHKMQVAIQEKDFNDLPNNGVVKLDDEGNLLDLVKKEMPNSQAELHGRMLLNKKIFTIKDLLKKHTNDEYYLTYALLYFRGEVMGYKYQGKYFNLGDKLGYIKASIYYAMQDDNVKEKLLKYIKTF